MKDTRDFRLECVRLALEYRRDYPNTTIDSIIYAAEEFYKFITKEVE